MGRSFLYTKGALTNEGVGKKLLRVIIIEDCREDSEVLVSYLKKYGDETGEDIKFRVFGTADEFLSKYSSTGLADLIFMDIEMPGTDGMNAAEKLREVDPDVFIIFTTNIAKYAVDGYKVNALDYFLKPVSYYDFLMRMKRVREYKNSIIRDGKKIKIMAVGGVRMVSTKDILYVESDNHVLTYHTVAGVFTSREKSMKQVETELAEYGFARCNVCYLVNLRKCEAVEGEEVTVGGEVLSISRGRRKEFVEALAKSVLF